VCGERTPICLEFHHLDPAQKKFNVGRIINSTPSVATIQREIDKCIVLCANCHRKFHAGLISEEDFSDKTDIYLLFNLADGSRLEIAASWQELGGEADGAVVAGLVQAVRTIDGDRLESLLLNRGTRE
jgi:hypothetical protein